MNEQEEIKQLKEQVKKLTSELSKFRNYNKPLQDLQSGEESNGYSAILIDEDDNNPNVGITFSSPSKTFQFRKLDRDIIQKGYLSFTFVNYKYHLMKIGNLTLAFWIPVDSSYTGTDDSINRNIIEVLARRALR